MKKRILFFDIDATLTRSVYYKREEPFITSLNKIYGVDLKKDGVVFSGGTAMSITRDLLGKKFLLRNEIFLEILAPKTTESKYFVKIHQSEYNIYLI